MTIYYFSGMGNSFLALEACAKLIDECNGTVSARYWPRLPLNNMDYDHIPIPVKGRSDVILRKAERRLRSICEGIGK